jgi:y4mF family transcriptional regulator
MGSRRQAPRRRTTPKAPAEEPSPAQVLGQTVRAQRRALRLTQEALCLHAGVGLAFLYELEAGKPTVRLDKVLSVLRVLGLQVTLAIATPDLRPGTIHFAGGAR